jgi:glycosyltransferase involved in cell wall biosynthesis
MLSSAVQPEARNLGSVAILIPAWKPDCALLSLVRALEAYGFGSIVLVDDGSGEDSEPLFRQAKSLPAVHVLTHAINLGKGRALKTGINHCLVSLPLCAGVVTADADGQHAPADIARVAETLLTSGTRMVLGSRLFANDVPLRSKFGNTLTRILFGFITGARLADTQTGLRGFPRPVLPELLALEGERYEYEMSVLAHICRTGPKPIEIPIETIYLDGNRSSHFDPIRDSMRIYFVLARFFASSILAAGIDFAGFSLAFALTHHVLASVVFGRLSSLVNFALNKKFVFHNRGSVTGALGRYYLLVIAIAALSYGLIRTLTTRAHWNVFLAKLTADILLSLVSFSMQRTFVFRKQAER